MKYFKRHLKFEADISGGELSSRGNGFFIYLCAVLQLIYYCFAFVRGIAKLSESICVMN